MWIAPAGGLPDPASGLLAHHRILQFLTPQHLVASGVDIILTQRREVSSSTTCSEVARWDGLLGSIEGKLERSERAKYLSG
jgi:hypothetical protein